MTASRIDSIFFHSIPLFCSRFLALRVAWQGQGQESVFASPDGSLVYFATIAWRFGRDLTFLIDCGLGHELQGSRHYEVLRGTLERAE
jgi:hypothetical protein